MPSPGRVLNLRLLIWKGSVGRRFSSGIPTGMRLRRSSRVLRRQTLISGLDATQLLRLLANWSFCPVHTRCIKVKTTIAKWDLNSMIWGTLWHTWSYTTSSWTCVEFTFSRICVDRNILQWRTIECAHVKRLLYFRRRQMQEIILKYNQLKRRIRNLQVQSVTLFLLSYWRLFIPWRPQNEVTIFRKKYFSFDVEFA